MCFYGMSSFCFLFHTNQHTKTRRRLAIQITAPYACTEQVHLALNVVLRRQLLGQIKRTQKHL